MRVDFNKDGQEDILWRYYGTGGYNRAWFLGNSGQASPPPSLTDSQIQYGPAVSKLAKTRATRQVLGRLQEMEIIARAKNRSTLMDAQDVMGVRNRRNAGDGLVDDPREAGGVSPEPSPLAIIDPRQAKSILSSATSSDAIIKIASTPTLLGGGDVMPVSNVNWQIVGTGDFNRDGSVDILWRFNGAGGPNVIWYLNGTNWSSSAQLLSVSDLNWQIVGTGDFNRDGNVDIFWRYNGSGGYVYVWYMDHANWAGGGNLISVADTSWQIAGTGDYNNDGRIDILWRYNGAGGYNYIWYLDGVQWIGGGNLLPVADLNWKIVSR
jgi:hypothetical protein